MTDIKEALAALDEASAQLEGRELYYLAFSKLKLVSDCLQSVAQEREDWRAIEEWRTHGNQTAAVVIGLLTEAKTMPTSFVGVDHETFAEALSRAATWARTEMAK